MEEPVGERVGLESRTDVIGLAGVAQQVMPLEQLVEDGPSTKPPRPIPSSTLGVLTMRERLPRRRPGAGARPQRDD